jgi:sugar phosphate isomerase/epimerase
MPSSLHPRLALNGIVTPGWDVNRSLDYWRSVGLRQGGMMAGTVREYGTDKFVAAMEQRELRVSSLVCGTFPLDQPSAWPGERAHLNEMIDVAAQLGGIVYGVPGKGRFDEWQENATRYAEAVAPCVEYGAAQGVTVAFEPSLRPYISFVHTLDASVDLAALSGASIIVDAGNCYAERDVRRRIATLGSRIALVQLSDVDIGTLAHPGRCERTFPGKGELPLGEFVQAACSAGYEGPFEIEFLGLGDVEADTVWKSLVHTSDVLDKAIGRS